MALVLYDEDGEEIRHPLIRQNVIKQEDDMKIIDVRWTPTMNILKIRCDCGKEFERRADKVKVTCPSCYKIGDLHFLKSIEGELCLEIQ